MCAIDMLEAAQSQSSFARHFDKKSKGGVKIGDERRGRLKTSPWQDQYLHIIA